MNPSPHPDPLQHFACHLLALMALIFFALVLGLFWRVSGGLGRMAA